MKTTTGAARYLFAACEAKTGDALAKLVLIALANRADNNGECYPSLERIAQDCETTKMTVTRKLKVLEGLGLLKKINRTVEGLKTSNLYQLPDVTQGYHVVTESHEGSNTVLPTVVTESYIKHPVETPIETPRVERKKRKRFIPPAREEVRAYVAEKNYRVDPDFFFDHFEAGDWHDAAGKPVKSWKQKLVTWNKREESNGKRNSNQRRTETPADRIRKDLERKIADAEAI